MSEPPLPLFPLNTVLFPEGPLALRVFEARYLDMVSACLREEHPFGVCLIRDGGSEVGQAADTYDVGTYARISDWNRYPDGLLGLTVVGEGRFRIAERTVQRDQLLVGRVEPLPADSTHELPLECGPLVELLRALIEHSAPLYDALPERYEDATWVGNRLAELLPIPLEHKQHLLEVSDPRYRLQQIGQMVEVLQADG